jgi:hypothetical protein
MPFLYHYQAKTMKKILLATALATSLCSQGQEPIDALRYTQTGHGGTARSRAIGGAITSLGGDISTATVNPAGLAFFRTNEFVFTPGLSFGSNKTQYLNDNTKGKYTSPDLSQAGLVFAKPGSWDGKWKNYTFGIGMNKTVNLGNTLQLNGLNNESSYSEKYLEELINNNVTDPNNAARNFPYGASLAFNTYLIDTLAGPGSSINGYKSLSTPQTGVIQNQEISSKGNINDMYFAASANFMDKLFLGGSLVFSKIRFERTSTFKETDATKKINNFNYFQTTEFLTSEGLGIGLKLGLIVKPIERLRIGLAFHSPTLYNMDDRYSTSISTDLEGYQGAGVKTQSSLDFNDGELGQYQYNFTTPTRFMAGISYVLNEVEDVQQQKGFISADVEFINYGNSRFEEPGSVNNGNQGSSYLQDVNQAIKDQFNKALNMRIGGELKFKTFMTRLGFNYLGNAYQLADLTASQMHISGGIGYRNMGFFTDLTYIHQIKKDATFPYRLDNGFYAPGIVKGAGGTLALTLGFKF